MKVKAKYLHANNKNKRYVDDTLSIMPNVQAASTFLSTLNEIHPSISFTMELEKNGKLPFLRVEIIRNSTPLDTKVYRKPTATGFLLHYNSHVDMKYKHSVLKTMLNRGFELSSNWQFFHQECERLMHQSIPAVPILPRGTSGQPVGICSRCQSRGWGIRNFIAAPGAGH